MADKSMEGLNTFTAEEAKVVDTTKKMRIGIIGCGGIAGSHIRAYLKQPDVEIVAGVDIIPGKAKKFMEKYGVEKGNEGRLVDFMSETEKTSGSEGNPTRENALRGRISSWIKQSEDVKSIYPDFDLRKELRENKLFSQLIMGGAPLKAAYETVHKDEILSGAMAYTADKVREQVVKGNEAKGRRPIENGVSSEAAVVTSVDVNSLTSQDILKILKQVENGANITF
jgi:hypothetical protein